MHSITKEEHLGDDIIMVMRLAMATGALRALSHFVERPNADANVLTEAIDEQIASYFRQISRIKEMLEIRITELHADHLTRLTAFLE